MLGFFKNNRPDKMVGSRDVPQEVQEGLESFLTKAFQDLVGEDKLSQESAQRIKEQLKQALIDACQHTQQEISLDIARQKLLHREYDQDIFAQPPQKTSEIDFLIENDNHTFVEHLFMFCQKEGTLDFWLTRGGASIPKDGLAQAIRLRANVFVFERLEQEGSFNGISQNDKQILVNQASLFLKNKPESLSYLKEALDRHADTSVLHS